MKARNTTTGEVVTSFCLSKEWGTASYIDNANILRFCTPRDGEWEIIDESAPIDWDAFRREAAKDILCALVGNKDYLKVIGRIEPETMLAIRFTDELIKQLKEEQK